MSKKSILFLLLVVLPLSLFSWHFLIKGRLSRFQAYEGTIQKGYKVYDPSKDIDDKHREAYLSYDHFWRVECSDGKVIEAKVPFHTWIQGRIGSEVVKESGDRFPRLRNQPETPRPVPTQAPPTNPPLEAPRLEEAPSPVSAEAAVEE